MNQSKQMVSLTTSRLSPLAKPFTFNRTTYQPTSYLSPKSEVYSLDHCDDDPFSSLLDSFRKSNLCSKGHSVSLDDYGFPQDTVTVTTTLPVETASSQTQENPLFEQHPSLELPKNGDFDGLNGSHFDVSLPTNSPCVTGLGYGTGNGNGVGYGKQGEDFHQSLFGKGNDVDSSVADASVFQNGKHAVDGLNPCLTTSDGIFEKSTGTVVAKDILSNSKGTAHAADESSSSLISNCKIAPLKLSTTGMSSAKNTPQNQFSKNLGDSDPDVDSPCWKGTMTSSLTVSEISGSVHFHLVEKPTEKHNNSLNPLAPQFYPGIGYIKDDFVSSNPSAPIATNLLSGEDILMKTVMEESLVELNKGIELQHSSNICGREKPFNVLDDPKNSSVDPVLNLHYMLNQSSSKEECSTSKGKFGIGTTVDVDDFVNGTKNLRASGSMSEVFFAKGHSPTPTTSSSQVNVVPDLFKTLEGFSKSLIESPKPDVKIIVSTMHVLSELLVQACVDGVDSSDEHDHDMIMIQQIINNLNVFSTKRCGLRISTPDSTPADSAFCHDRSLELPKGLEMSRIETLNVPHQLYLQNDYMGKNRVSKMIGQTEQSSFAASSNEGTERGNEIVQLQVIRRSLGKSLDFDKQMHPEALLFSNLWLDAEAESCYRKYKTYHSLMQADHNASLTWANELWR